MAEGLSNAALRPQVEAIAAALKTAANDYDVSVKPAICFVHAEWPRFAKPFSVDGVGIGWPKALGALPWPTAPSQAGRSEL